MARYASGLSGKGVKGATAMGSRRTRPGRASINRDPARMPLRSKRRSPGRQSQSRRRLTTAASWPGAASRSR